MTKKKPSTKVFHPSHNLRLTLKIEDQFGQVIAVVHEEIDPDVMDMGLKPPSADPFHPNFILGGLDCVSPFEQTVRLLERRMFRRGKFMNMMSRIGQRMANFLEDKEGWHGDDRANSTKQYLKEVNDPWSGLHR